MKVLVALDDSPFSKGVVNSILSRPWPAHTTFKIVNVIEPMCIVPSDYDPGEFQNALNKMMDIRRASAEKLCDSFLNQFKKKLPESQVIIEIREGSAKNEIVNSAIDWNADKILVGAHGRDVCPHNLLGSVSRSVVNTAPCSVEVVRTHAIYKEVTTDDESNIKTLCT